MTEKARLYDSMIRNLPVGFSMVDRDGNIAEFNRAAEEITGYRKKEVKGRPHLQTLHGTDDENACPLLRGAMRRRKRSISVEAKIRKKDGEMVDVAVTSYPIYDAEGRFDGGVELFREITEQKRKERERRNFLSMFVHDMRKPVFTSKGYLSRLQAEKAGPLTHRQRDYLDVIGDNLGRLEDFIEEFLEFSKFEAKAYRPSPEPVRMDRLIRENIRAFKAVAEERNVSIRFMPEGEAPEVRADRNMINRVLSNLVENAVKYTPEGGAVRVRCRRAGDGVAVEVINPGEGIPESELPRVFDAFHRARADVGGIGLGLAISKQIVNLHGGRIRARRTPEGDTMLSFTLPGGRRPSRQEKTGR